ncbi:MAG: NAD(P)/FAD-dependent oxidoreductase [Gammaproteobacteria bacterium]|nr:NAD(P)/FAD-dependent oxidoreductase [Gammaproteobacteria bacterium]
MKTFNRRSFLRMAGIAGSMAMLPRTSLAAAPRVVVIGGGFGGASVAKYLRLWGGNVNVTLVDPASAHVSCILSNLVVTGLVGMSRITLSYQTLRTTHGVSVVQGRALSVDPPGKRVTISTAKGNQTLDYDHLVIAPGIDFVAPPGNWNPSLTPHAWQAGTQTTLLKNQLATMRNNDRFVMTIPKSPYRCPPGPYERACMVADYLKRMNRAGAMVVVLDANASIQAEPEAFTRAFNVTHAGRILYVPNANVQSVDSASRSITTSAMNVSNAKVLNIIPAHRAGGIAAALGVNASGFVPVDPLTYGITGYPNVHVIGDASAVPASDGKAVPKSGHMANSEAKVCADAILRAFNGEAPDRNIATSSACYSPITARSASWLSANFIYGDIFDATGAVKGKGMHRVDLGEAPTAQIDQDTYQDMFTWADSLFTDSFA